MAQVRIETDYAAFMVSIENWDGQSPPFPNVVASAIHHAFRCFKADEFRQRLVDRMECMGSTVVHWASGRARPHPLVQRSVVAEIAALIKEIDETHRQENARMIAAMRRVGDSSDE